MSSLASHNAAHEQDHADGVPDATRTQPASSMAARTAQACKHHREFIRKTGDESMAICSMTKTQ